MGRLRINPSRKHLTTEVAVVGAGLAGLVAARHVARAGVDTLVLEAQGRVGGRLLNQRVGSEDNVVDLGGQWVGPRQRRLRLLAAELGISIFPTYSEGLSLLAVDGKVASYLGELTDYRPGLIRDLWGVLAPVAMIDFEQARARLDRMASAVSPEQPWAAAQAARWDEQTLGTWIRRNTRTAAARKLFELTTEAVWAAEPGDLSLLHALFYIRAGEGIKSLIATRGGAQQDRFSGGAQLLALRIAEELGSERLRLGTPIRRIERADGGLTLISEEGRLTVRAKQVIVAVPPPLAARIAFAPPLPGLRDQLTQRMPQGTVIKTMAIYSHPFWRLDGLSGQAITDLGPARVVFDNSPPTGSAGILLGFIEGKAARDLGRLPGHDRRMAVIEGHAKLFGSAARTPEQFVEKVWADDPWSRGCYGCLMTPLTWTQFGPFLRRSIGGIHWAGTETATEWAGYMEGAVQSAERASNEVLAETR